jgi:hypothetical protein
MPRRVIDYLQRRLTALSRPLLEIIALYPMCRAAEGRKMATAEQLSTPVQNIKTN